MSAPVAKTYPRIEPSFAQRSGSEFTVDRAVVDDLLLHPSLSKPVVVTPESENGKVVCLRLFNVGPDTIFGALGFEDGDGLESINGFDVTNPTLAVTAYARLRTASHLDVKVRRHGKKMSLRYNLT